MTSYQVAFAQSGIEEIYKLPETGLAMISIETYEFMNDKHLNMCKTVFWRFIVSFMLFSVAEQALYHLLCSQLSKIFKQFGQGMSFGISQH